MPKTTAPRLKTLARMINEAFPDLEATVEWSHFNTDRVVNRIRWPGKGRWGNCLEVRERARPWIRVLEHHGRDGYRDNADVLRWIEDEKRRRAAEPTDA